MFQNLMRTFIQTLAQTGGSWISLHYRIEKNIKISWKKSLLSFWFFSYFGRVINDIACTRLCGLQEGAKDKMIVGNGKNGNYCLMMELYSGRDCDKTLSIDSIIELDDLSDKELIEKLYKKENILE